MNCFRSLFFKRHKKYCKTKLEHTDRAMPEWGMKSNNRDRLHHLKKICSGGFLGVRVSTKKAHKRFFDVDDKSEIRIWQMEDYMRIYFALLGHKDKNFDFFYLPQYNPGFSSKNLMKLCFPLEKKKWWMNEERRPKNAFLPWQQQNTSKSGNNEQWHHNVIIYGRTRNERFFPSLASPSKMGKQERSSQTQKIISFRFLSQMRS